MKIDNFKDKKIRELCEINSTAVKRLGVDCARKLHARLDDLDAADRVTDLTAGNPHPLKGDRIGQYSVSLAGGMRLVFTPNHNPCLRLEDGSIDWSSVANINIEFIGDYHD